MTPARTHELDEALRRQREAIVTFDSQALLDASAEVLRSLAALRDCEPPLTAGELTALRAAQTALRANAVVLNQANAVNERGLSALFEAPALYGSSGSSASQRRSRPLDAA